MNQINKDFLSLLIWLSKKEENNECELKIFCVYLLDYIFYSYLDGSVNKIIIKLIIQNSPYLFCIIK